MRCYDAHNHAQDQRLQDYAPDCVAEAQEAGVVRMVVNGTCEQDWPSVAALAARYPDCVVPSFGVHPWFVHECGDGWRAQLTQWLDRHPYAVGEIGLDRWKTDLPWAGQEEAFQEQLAIAAERNLPVSIHCLRAWGPLFDILQAGPRPERGFLLHSYGGSIEMAERFLDLGACFSFPASFARERKTRQRDVFKQLPIDRILLETDAPDQQPPRALRRYPPEQLNHPANLSALYPYVAELLGQSPPAWAEQVERTFKRLFDPA